MPFRQGAFNRRRQLLAWLEWSSPSVRACGLSNIGILRLLLSKLRRSPMRLLLALTLLLACASPRRYFVYSELHNWRSIPSWRSPRPWKTEDVPVVLTDTTGVLMTWSSPPSRP